MKATRLFLEWAVLFALSISGILFLQASELTYRIDNQLLDSLSAVSRPVPSDDIALVAIDDRSLAETGNWPWPRSEHAKLIGRLNDAGARVIVLDILFLEESDDQEDAALEQAMREGGNVLLPHTFTDRLNAQSGVEPLLPLPRFQHAAAAIGHVAANTDSDGILRRFELLRSTDKGDYPHLAVKVLELMERGGLQEQHGPTALITFNPEETPQYFSASRVIAGEYPAEFFANKIVMVGATAQGMGDRYSVASGSVRLMTGIETQSNLINALLTDAVISPASKLWQNVIAITALIVLFLSFWYLSPRWCLYGSLAIIAILFTLSAGLLAVKQIWLPVVPAIVMIVLAYPLWSWRRLTLVSHYLDREVLRLTSAGQSVKSSRGMEYVAHQVEEFSGLVHSIEGSLSFLRQVIEAAPDAIIVIDEDSRLKMLNDKANQLFAFWDEGDAPTLEELFISSQMSVKAEGNEMSTADGRSFLIARAALGGRIKGGFAGEILSLRDISAIRQLDQERKQMLEFLSHDMRTPQVAIIGLTRSQKPLHSLGETLSRIRKQANRTLKLADDFVQLARLENTQLQLEDSDLTALIEEACDRAYVLADAKEIAISQQLPQEPSFADVDASLIARMLDNLIGNAVKYSPIGSTITVGLSAQTGNAYQIIIADEGEGLPEARLKDPFARFGAHVSDAGPSAGLGLALVKKVVDAHEGVIDVTSQKGKGTRFTISFGGLCSNERI